MNPSGAASATVAVNPAVDRTVAIMYLAATSDGRRVIAGMLRLRFVAARTAAAQHTEKAGNAALVQRIGQFQFRDARAKVASELDDAGDAAKLVGHSDKRLTKDVYRRVGERAKPTKSLPGQPSACSGFRK